MRVYCPWHASGLTRDVPATRRPGAAGSNVMRVRVTRVRVLAAAVLAAGLLAAGCAPQPVASAAAADCLRVSTMALTRHSALRSVPAACGRLGKTRLTAVVAAAVAAAARQQHGKALMRARLRTLGPLLPRLRPGTGTGPAPPGPAAGGEGGGQGGGLPLGLAALAAWLVTAGLGTAMMARWIFRGGIRGARHRAGGRAAMNFAHLGLALSGLAIWAGYLLTGLSGLSWAACLFLLPVTGLGMSLLVLRLPGQAPAAVAALAPGQSPGLAIVARPGLAARPPGVLIIAAHVAFAVATMLLTLLAAIGSG